MRSLDAGAQQGALNMQPAYQPQPGDLGRNTCIYVCLDIPRQQLASLVLVVALSVAQLINWFNNKNKALAALAFLQRLTETNKKLPSFLLFLPSSAIDCRGLAFFKRKKKNKHFETIKNGNLFALPFLYTLLSQSYVSHALLMSGYNIYKLTRVRQAGSQSVGLTPDGDGI